MNSCSFRKSDRERAGLHDSVKTCADEGSITEFAEDGRILSWSGNTSTGKAERLYSYDNGGRLLSIRGSAGDQTDIFHYDEQGGKKRVRAIPPKPGRKQCFTGVGILLEVTEEGGSLVDGGSVITSFNEWDKPIESQVLDTEGHLLTNIVHEYDTQGRLLREELIPEYSEFAFPKQFRDQIPAEQRDDILSQMRQQFKEHAVFGKMERSYVYDSHDRIAERHMRLGEHSERVTFTYNDHGEKSEMIFIWSGGLPAEYTGPKEQQLVIRFLYRYDDYGNWTEETTSSCTSSDGHFKSSAPHHRTFTYY